MKITIDLTEILDHIYAESAWHAAYDEKIRLLTPDNERMLEMRIEDGLYDLRPRLAGYITQWNYNPHLESGNISMTLQFRKEQPGAVEQAMHDAIVELLAAYALKCFYGEEGTYYGTAWRLYRTKVMLIMSRDQL